MIHHLRSKWPRFSSSEGWKQFFPSIIRYYGQINQLYKLKVQEWKNEKRNHWIQMTWDCVTEYILIIYDLH